MKTAIRRKYGNAEVLTIEERPVPEPGSNEILVQVHATTINRTDCANLTGKPFVMHFTQGFFRPSRPVPGTDFAGVVTKTGTDVTEYSAGDRVYGFKDAGLQTQAEFAAIKIGPHVQKMPEGVGFAEAVASLEGAHYAYTFIAKTNIQSGQKVMINGATGAIGSALLQIVRQFEVEITATADTPNLEQIRELGADKVIDYTQTDFTQVPAQYDYVFDAVGKSTLGKCKPVLKPGGIYISSELGPGGQNLFFALLRPLTGSRKVIFPVPYPVKTTLPWLKQKLAEGKLKPLIDRSYPLAEIREAYAYVQSGRKTGNVLLDLSGKG